MIGSERARVPLRLAHLLHVELRFGSLENVLAEDVQAWLNRFLTKINELADSIRQTYLEAL